MAFGRLKKEKKGFCTKYFSKIQQNDVLENNKVRLVCFIFNVGNMAHCQGDHLSWGGSIAV